MRHRRVWIAGAVGAALIAWIYLHAGPPPPLPKPPESTWAFAALGDAPYYPWESFQYRLVMRDLEAHDLDAVLHVGDIFWHPCYDALYQHTLRRFKALRFPVLYTPGDNEWADCWESGSGSYDPHERLRRIRQIFFDPPGRSHGGATVPLVSQGGGGMYSEFVENVRWEHQGYVIATVNLPGSENGLERFHGTAPAPEIAARRQRTMAAAEWTRAAFAEARAAGSEGVILAFHAEMGLRAPPRDAYRQAYEPFITVLEEEAEAFGKPVLLVHGDGHEYTVDKPLIRRTTGKRLENVFRLEVPGSPILGWVRVMVTPGRPDPFSFEQRVLPRYKYW
ncbi:MAG TPA: metallophosphoesterase family protein [Candidatus Polarisedimenticolia bacterium]|nr:metallophosphoesterase family protein [Candidatus Polarisedimenticolia bacterium]